MHSALNLSLPDHLDIAGGAAGKVRPVRCFTAAHRLLKPEEYEQVFNATGYAAGQRVVQKTVPRGYQSSGGGVMVRAIRNGGSLPRLGLIISKKSIRRAVDRNRVKRLVRESFRLCQTRLSGLDVVIMSRAGLGELPNPKLRAVLDKHWDALARWRAR